PPRCGSRGTPPRSSSATRASTERAARCGARRADGSEVLRPTDPRLGFQEIRRAKRASGLRVVVFGESAAAGLGFSPNATFARERARLLGAAYPLREIEVLNLAIVGIASEQVKVLVAEAARAAEPDLLVVYCGHNEFLEAHARRWAEHAAPPLRRALLAL